MSSAEIDEADESHAWQENTMQGTKVSRRDSLKYSAAALVCFIAAWAGSTMRPAQNGPAILKLSIIDETTKKPTPARVEVLDKDGHAYVAEDALLIGGD
jgi:hypothetical protein